MQRRTDVASSALDESLQADVMRFMAIIAFCLVAIMALARNATPLAAQPATPEPVDRLQDLPAPLTRAGTAAAPEAPDAAEGPDAGEVPEAASVADPSPPAEPVEARTVAEAASVGDQAVQAPARPEALEPVVAALEPATAPVTEARRFVAGRPVVEPISAAASAPSPATPGTAPEPAPEAAEADAREAAGLSLRFASDGDFLRLVSREAIEVYAFRDGEVFALSPGLRFAAVRAPGRVHELLPTTIPAPVGAALADVRADAQGFRWGVRMPGRIERRVREHVDAGASGVLVIDRFGEVKLLAGAMAGESNG